MSIISEQYDIAFTMHTGVEVGVITDKDLHTTAYFDYDGHIEEIDACEVFTTQDWQEYVDLMGEIGVTFA